MGLRVQGCPMNDRRGFAPPVDVDGVQLIDAGVLRMWLGMTHAGARGWANRHGVHPVRKGAHGASLYRLADLQSALDKAPRNPLSSEM